MSKLLVGIVLGLSFSLAYAQSQRITLRFDRVVELTKNAKYSLLDIATVEGADRKSLDLIRQIDLSALVSSTRVLKPAELIPSIKNRLKENDIDATFVLGGTVGFKIVEDALSIKHFTRLFTPYMQLDCANCTIELSSDHVQWHLTDWAVAEMPEGLQSSITVPMQIADSQSFRWLSFRVKAWKDVPVLLKSVANNDIITEENLGLKKVDLTVRRNIATEKKDILGRHVQGMISAQVPIDMNHIAKDYTIRRGQKTRALLGNDVIEVSTVVEVLQDGIKGDIVRVRGVENRKELQARIIDSETVRIE